MKFEELEPDVRRKLIQADAEAEGQDFDGTWCADRLVEVCELMGIHIDRRGEFSQDHAVYWSGFWSQGDGASFEGTRQPRDDHVRRG
jgi:hypothetical protein